MDAEAAIVLLLGVVVFLSFHFPLLSFYKIDNAQKVGFVPLAASAIIASVISFAVLMIYFAIKRVFSRTDNRLAVLDEPSTGETQEQ